MKRTALAVLGVALLLISFTACNPSSNNGPIVLPDRNPDKNPPSQEPTAQEIADALNIPQLLSNLLETKNGAYEVAYEYYDSTSSQIAISAPPVAAADAGLKATVTFIDDYKVNNVTIAKDGTIVYKIPGNKLADTGETSFNADGTCTVEEVNLTVNGKKVDFTATASIEITATFNGDEVTVSSISATVTKVENTTIGGAEVSITVPENPDGGDPVEPGDNEEESGGVDGEQEGEFGTNDPIEPVA